MGKIEWCDYTINPVVGCSKCSPGCEHCFAERFAARLAKNPNPDISAKYYGSVDDKGNWTGEWGSADWSCFQKLPKKPCRVFVGSMTDIFKNIIPPDIRLVAYLPRLFEELEKRPDFTFMLLTKRPQNMKNWIELYRKTLPNVWLGVTVCNQEEANEKLPILMKIPAAKRFVSVEPMLSGIDISQYLQGDNKLDWIIAGAETGHNARPLHPVWARSLRDQCLETETPFFFKSWGEWLPCTQFADDFDEKKYPVGHIESDGLFFPPPALTIPLRNNVYGVDTIRVGKKRSGYLIDGVEYRQFPEV